VLHGAPVLAQAHNVDVPDRERLVGGGHPRGQVAVVRPAHGDVGGSDVAVDENVMERERDWPEATPQQLRGGNETFGPAGSFRIDFVVDEVRGDEAHEHVFTFSWFTADAVMGAPRRTAASELFFGCYADPGALPEVQQLPALIEAELQELGCAATHARADDAPVAAS
jgi:hypothetical protein